MKNIFSFCTAVLLVVALQQNLFAQNSPKFMNTRDEDAPLRNALKMNLINAAFSYPSFAYERKISDKLGFQIDGVFRMGNKTNTASTSFTNNGKAIQSFIIYPAIRYYFFENSKLKFENYLSVYYKYRNFKSTNDYSDGYNPYGIDYSNTYTESTSGGGLLLGLQSAGTTHFIFDLFFGTQLQTSSGSFKFNSKSANLIDFKNNYSLSSVSDPFSFMNSSSLRAGFTIGVKF